MRAARPGRCVAGDARRPERGKRARVRQIRKGHPRPGHQAGHRHRERDRLAEPHAVTLQHNPDPDIGGRVGILRPQQEQNREESAHRISFRSLARKNSISGLT